MDVNANDYLQVQLVVNGKVYHKLSGLCQTEEEYQNLVRKAYNALKEDTLGEISRLCK